MSYLIYLVCWILVGVFALVALPRWWRGMPDQGYGLGVSFMRPVGTRMKHGSRRGFGIVVFSCWDAIAAAGFSSLMMHSKGVVHGILIFVSTILILILLASLFMTVTVIYLNWPKFLVPPHMRAEPAARVGWMKFAGRDAVHPHQWEDGAYEARYGWNRRSGTVLGVCLLIFLFGLFSSAPLALRVLAIAASGAGFLLTAGSSLMHQIALRVDGSGVTTNVKPLSRNGARLCPWNEIGAVVIWSSLPLTWVGIITSGEIEPEQINQLVRPSGRAARAVVAAGLPYEVAANAVGTAGWVLQTSQLTAAVARFAPHVKVIDKTS